MGLVPESHDTIIGDRGAIYITVMDAHKLSVNGKSDILLKENLSILRESKSGLDQRISEAIAEEFGL